MIFLRCFFLFFRGFIGCWISREGLWIIFYWLFFWWGKGRRVEEGDIDVDLFLSVLDMAFFVIF